MSLSSAKLSIDGTAVKMAAANGMPLEVHIHIAAGALLIGDSTVSAANGYLLDNGDKLTFTVPDGSELWGLASGGGTTTVYVLTAIL